MHVNNPLRMSCSVFSCLKLSVNLLGIAYSQYILTHSRNLDVAKQHDAHASLFLPSRVTRVTSSIMRCCWCRETMNGVICGDSVEENTRIINVGKTYGAEGLS